jgi:hypothetical protein
MKGIRKVVSLDGESAGLLEERRNKEQSYSDVVKRLCRDRASEGLDDAVWYLTALARSALPEEEQDSVALRLAEVSQKISRGLASRRQVK